jgi:hypothetical protein
VCNFLQSLQEIGSRIISVGLVSRLLPRLQRNRGFIVRRERFVPSVKHKSSWHRTSCSKHVCLIRQNESFIVRESIAVVLGKEGLSFQCVFFFIYIFLTIFTAATAPSEKIVNIPTE